jgi:hypothetical protein
MKRVEVAIYGSFVSCEDDLCMLRKLCANHSSAGDYRSEYGIRPELQALDVLIPGRLSGTVYCKTHNVTYEDPNSPGDVMHPEFITRGDSVTANEVDPQLPMF